MKNNINYTSWFKQGGNIKVLQKGGSSSKSKNKSEFKIDKKSYEIRPDNIQTSTPREIKLPIPLTHEQEMNLKMFGSFDQPSKPVTYFSKGQKKTPGEIKYANAKLEKLAKQEKQIKDEQKYQEDKEDALRTLPYVVPGLGQAMWLGTGVDLAVSGASDGKYKSWGNMVDQKTGSGEFLGDLTNPGYYAGALPKLLTKGVQSTSKYALQKAEPYLMGDKRIPMMGGYKPKMSFIENGTKNKVDLKTLGINSDGSYLTGVRKSLLKEFDNRNFFENLNESAPLLIKTITHPKLAKRISLLPDGIVKNVKGESLQNLNKLTYTFNKIKKSGIGIDDIKNSTFYMPEDYTRLGKSKTFSDLEEYLKYHLTKSSTDKKSLVQAKKFEAYLLKDFETKLNKITDPNLKNIVNESPQYLDEVYNHSINPKTSTDEFVNNLIKRTNTFQRWVSKDTPTDEMLQLKGSSLGFNNKKTIDVDGLIKSGDYGDYGYIFEPGDNFMDKIKSLPLEEKWANRKPVEFTNGVNIDYGIHGGTSPKFQEYQFKRLRRIKNENPFAEQSIHVNMDNFSNINPKYIHPPQHMVFNTAESGKYLQGFNVKKISEMFPNISNDWYLSQSKIANMYQKALTKSGILSKGYSTLPIIGLGYELIQPKKQEGSINYTSQFKIGGNIQVLKKKNL